MQIPPRGISLSGRHGIWTDRNAAAARSAKRSARRSEYKKLIHRLNRIEGQIRGIRSMVESGAYCPDILVQAAAVNAAVNAFNKELLAAHIRTCVAEDIRAGRDETIDELVTTLAKAHEMSEKRTT